MRIYGCVTMGVLLWHSLILGGVKGKAEGSYRTTITSVSGSSTNLTLSEWARSGFLWDGTVRIGEDLTATYVKQFPTSKASLTTQLGVLLSSEERRIASVAIATSQVKMSFYRRQGLLHLTISKTNFHDNCYQVHWFSNEATALRDCFDTISDHWFGLGEIYEQLWPLNKGSFNMSLFTVQDFLSTHPHGKNVFGSVLEPFLVSSNGVGVYVHDEEKPIAVSLNTDGKQRICVETGSKGKFGTTRNDNNRSQRSSRYKSELKYTVCMAPNVKDVHQLLSKEFLPLPQGHPDLRMITEPVWSTWVLCKKNVNQSAVLEFAYNIRKFNLSASHIEIDDMYSTWYGDFDFDRKKFPQLKQMVDALTEAGFRLTAWVHPFCNTDARCFKPGTPYFVQVEDEGREMVGITTWWDGNGGILDTTNPRATGWFLQRLNDFKKIGLSGFKFDAGEVNYLPKNPRFNTPQLNPNKYATHYVAMASASGSLTEVRVGYRSQQYPVFVRALDRDSTWGYDNGLRSVLTSALTFSILGYPFVLPDMIGGNAYKTQPSKELYIRWAQLSVFLPGLQFSFPPWKYKDPEVMAIIHSALAIRKKLSGYLVQLAVNVKASGDSIVRPLWWYWPQNEHAMVADEEFMFGDRYLVAPVLHPGVTLHRVYLPPGVWKEEWGNRRTWKVVGEGEFVEYRVSLNDVPYFRLLKML